MSQLPPELLRKERFDEIFFVDLPDTAARGAIWELHLAKRELSVSEHGMVHLVDASDGYSGAEIEAAVVGAAYRAFGAGRQLDEQDVLAEIEATDPLSVTRAEDVAGLRAWASNRAVAA